MRKYALILILPLMLVGCETSYRDQIANAENTMAGLNNAAANFIENHQDCDAHPEAVLCTTEENREHVKSTSKMVGDLLRGAEADANDPSKSDDDIGLAISAAQRMLDAFLAILRDLHVPGV